MVAAITLILAAIGTLILGFILELIISGFKLLGMVIYVDLDFFDDLTVYVVVISLCFVVAKALFEILNTYIINFLDDRLENYNPFRILVGAIKAVISMAFVPFFVRYAWQLAGLLVRVVSLDMDFDLSTLLTVENIGVFGLFPMFIMVVVYLIALIVIMLQFSVRMAEYIFSVYSGYVNSVALVNDKMTSPVYSNWITNVLGLTFIQASQVLCVNLSLRNLKALYQSGSLSGLIDGRNIVYFLLSIGFIILCAKTPATIKQLAQSTGVREGLSAGAQFVRTAVSLKK